MSFDKFIWLVLLFIIFADGKIVDASKNGRVAYEDGLQINLKSDCWINYEPAEEYEKADGVSCYKQNYDIANTLWSVNTSGPISQDAENPCDPVMVDVNGPCIFSALEIKEKGTQWYSQSVLCSKCLYRCKDIADSSIENYTFTVYAPCENSYKVVSVSGTATAGGTTMRNGQEIDMAGTVQTGDNSSLQIELKDGSQIKLGPNSKVQMNCDDLNPTSPKFQLHLFLGEVWSEVMKITGQEPRFEIRTERACAGVRGTSFLVSDDGIRTKVLVGEGKVAVWNIPKTDSTMLTKCEAAKVEAGVISIIDPFGNDYVNCGGAAVKNPVLKRNNGWLWDRVEYYNVSGKKISGNFMSTAGIEHNSIYLKRTISPDGKITVKKIICK